MANITILELAAALGLSKSTVSRAFRDNADINPKTKEYILEKAKELGYFPNIYASNLRGNRSSTIAIILPEFGNKFFSQAIKGIESVARSQNFHTLIYVTEHQAKNEESIVRSLTNGRVDGVLMSASGEGQDHSHVDLLRENGIPLVFFDRYYEDVPTISVTGNDYESAYKATRHLLENGCQKVAYFVINKDISIGKVRMQGYLDALRDLQMPFNPDLVLDTFNEHELSFNDIEEFMLRVQPDGIFAAVERLAMNVLRVAKKHHIDIPKQVKLICFSCLDISDLLAPALSVVKQPAYEMGQVAAQELFTLIKNPKLSGSKKLVILDSALNYQASSG